MPISRKPKSQETPPIPVNVEALIAKGGSVAQPIFIGPTEAVSNKETASFTLRVPQDILETLDAHRKKQSYKVPRQQWILEAIMQRLEREMLPHAPQD